MKKKKVLNTHILLSEHNSSSTSSLYFQRDIHLMYFCNCLFFEKVEVVFLLPLFPLKNANMKTANLLCLSVISLRRGKDSQNIKAITLFYKTNSYLERDSRFFYLSFFKNEKSHTVYFF